MTDWQNDLSMTPAQELDKLTSPSWLQQDCYRADKVKYHSGIFKTYDRVAMPCNLLNMLSI